MSSRENPIPWNERKTVRPRDVADYTGLSLGAVYVAIREGRLPARKMSPMIWLIKPEDVDAWLEAGDEAAKDER